MDEERAAVGTSSKKGGTNTDESRTVNRGECDAHDHPQISWPGSQLQAVVWLSSIVSGRRDTVAARKDGVENGTLKTGRNVAPWRSCERRLAEL